MHPTPNVDAVLALFGPEDIERFEAEAAQALWCGTQPSDVLSALLKADERDLRSALIAELKRRG